MTLASFCLFFFVFFFLLYLMPRVRSGGGLDEDQVSHHDRWGQLRLRLVARGVVTHAKCSVPFSRAAGSLIFAGGRCHEPLLDASRPSVFLFLILFLQSVVVFVLFLDGVTPLLGY